MKIVTEEDDLVDFIRNGYNDQEWLDVTMGAWEMQLPQERDNAGYPETLCYRTSFTAGYLPGNTRLLIDGFSGSNYKLFVNGIEYMVMSIEKFAVYPTLLLDSDY